MLGKTSASVETKKHLQKTTIKNVILMKKLKVRFKLKDSNQ